MVCWTIIIWACEYLERASGKHRVLIGLSSGVGDVVANRSGPTMEAYAHATCPVLWGNDGSGGLATTVSDHGDGKSV